MIVRKNVAIIIPGGIGTGKNNQGIPVLELLVTLLAKDFAVTVFQLHKMNKNYSVESFEVVEVPIEKTKLNILKFGVAFWKHHRKKRFIAVHGFWALPSGLLAVIMGKLFKIKSIISLQGGDAISLPQIRYGQLQRWFPRKLVLWSLRNVDVLVSPTKFLTDTLRGFGLTREDVKFVPLGIDTQRFKFKRKSMAKPVKFLHIGNFNLVKDQETLLHTFNAISKKIPCRLTIVGEGELENVLRSLITTLGLDKYVDFRQPVGHEQLCTVYENADILLHTSLSEGHPIVVAEAMACGVLICGTRVGLLYDLKDCCISAPTKDSASLANGILNLIENVDLQQRIQGNAFQWASNHSIYWTIEEFKKIYL